MFFLTVYSKKPLLKELQNLVTPYYAASWKEIGLQLGIPKGILQSIEIKFQTDVETCCNEMLMEWLDTDVTASWGKIIKIAYSPAVTEIINAFSKSPLCNRKELAVSDSVDELEGKLKDRHIVTRYKSSEEEDWFCEPEHFTSVALIHQKRLKTRRDIIEFANMHLKGGFIKSGKVTTNIADVFALAECTGHSYTLLIEGAPGIGKTVLSKEIVFQWAKGNLLKNQRLVFLVYFRDPKTRMINTFDSLINYISYSQISKSIEQYIASTSGKGVTIVFDGYDEYPEGLREHSFLSDVINRKTFELQSCNMVITSRPSASGFLHNRVDLRVEILGFTKEHRKSYIVHALKDNPNAIQELLRYLESNFSVDAYCHVPLSMAILVFLFKESDYNKYELPTTQTAINYKFVLIIIRRFIKKFQKEPLMISNFSEVPQPYKQILLEISKLAFKALQEDNIVFSANEIRGFCPSLLKDSEHWNGLDLLKAVQYFNLEENGNDLSFNFLHFSVQELLAAYHISLMSKSNQIKLLKETFWNSRYFNTWIMYVALTKDKPFGFRHFLSGNRLRLSTKFSIWWSGNAYISISKNMKESKIKRLHLFQCFTEAGNDDMCHYIGNLLQDGKIDLGGQTLSAVELYILSSFLARCVHRQWSLLDLSNCYLDDENFERFYKSYASLTKSIVYINTIDLSSNALTAASASQIANLVLNFNVKRLVFASNEIKDLGIDQTIFAALLEHPNLTQSRFIEIQDENMVNLVLYKKGLNTSIASELFIMCYCTTETYKDVCLYIENNSSFFEMLLKTSSASIFKTMLHSWISKMTFFSTNFILSLRTINAEEINSTINSLAYNFPLAVCIGENSLPLHLYNFSNGVDDKIELFDSLGTIFFSGKVSVRKIHSMFQFFLVKDIVNQIYLNGVVLYDHLMDVSPKCISLNSLQLLNCCAHGITEVSTVANVSSQIIDRASSLSHLNLSGCRMKTEHMKIILKAIISIKTIAISDNNLAKEVANILASVINCNKELQSIELSSCNLQEAAIVSVTEELGTCEDLQSLDLSNNVITDDVAVHVAMVIDKCQLIKNLRLQNCQLQYAGMQKIVEVMIKKTCLQFIDLSYNAVSYQNTLLIASVIVNNKKLRKLNFSNCKLQNTGCQQLFQAIAKTTSLVHLDLSNNLFTDVEVDDFALMIHQNLSLEYLNISGCCVKAKDFEKVTHSLVTLKSLTHLDLSCNVFNNTSAENVAVIITNNDFLENLKCEIRKSPFLKIITALQNKHYLKYLYLNSNSIDYEKATGIATVISNNPFLENVDLSNCSLTEKEMKTILSSLRNHNSLKQLDVSSITITDNEITDIIDSNTQLTHLNISDTEISQYGILKIFKAAQRINTLRCIKMCNCTISDQAAQAIADAISVNCMMEELIFINNDFHETGIAMLFDVLRESHTLKCLTIASNNIISGITTEVAKVVSNNHITYFDLSNCDLEKSSCSSILNTLILQAPNLQHVDLSGNNLSGNAKAIAQLISFSYYLQYLNLANTLMQDEEIKIIVKAMQNINSLHYVDLTSYSINDDSELALELQNTIDKNPAMISFQFSRLYFKNNPAPLTKLVKSIVFKLQEISICFSNCENDQVGTTVTLISNNLNLQHLHLENCSLLDIDISNIIIALARTTTLKYFCLINVVITDKVDDGISAIIKNNTQLKHFQLVACKITEKDLQKCIQLFNMRRLSHLVLSKMDNIFSHTARQLKRPICNSLTHLNLSNVHLYVTKLLCLSLPALTKLQYLDLSHNPLTDESADILSEIILNNIGLKHLDLCECNLRSEGINIVADSLEGVNIAYLDMSLNTINIHTFNNNVMPALLSNLNVIECLYLPYCELKQTKIDKILDFIRIAFKLKVIDFGPNTIPIEKINNFKNIVFVSQGNKHVCFDEKGIKKTNFSNHESKNLYHSLHYLNVNNVIVDDEVGNTIAALIANSPELEYLEISECEWNITNIMKCLIALQDDSHLMHLQFSNNHNNYSLTEMFYLLRRFTALKVLDLHNCCRLKNAITMTTEGPGFLHLTYLDLSNNYIDDVAVDYLAALIAINVELEYLNLHNCGLKSSDIKTINNALKLSSSIKFLDVSLNEIDDNSLVDDLMISELASNKHLEQLRLSSIILDTRKFHQIQSNLLVIKGLQRLIINDCFFMDKDASRIITFIINNPTLNELCLLGCEMSMKSKIEFSCIATALCLQYLKLDTITVTNPINKSIKHSLNRNTSLHCNTSKCNLTDDDVVAVITVDHNLRELIMFKLILNQNNLKVLGANRVTIRYLKILHIQDCIFTDYYCHYLTFLIGTNATTIQSISLTACQMSIKQKMIITKALCRLNIILLQHLDVKDNLYIDDMKHETSASLKSCFTETNCKLTDDFIRAVMTDLISLKISKLVLNQHTLAELKGSLKLMKGVIHLTINYCKFNTDDDNSVGTLIADNDCIQEFILSNCLLPHKYSEVFMGLSFLRSLSLITFDTMVFTHQEEDILPVIFMNNPGLSHFTMIRCEITKSGLVKVMHSIAKNLGNLQYINFSHLKCSYEVVNHITTVITYNTKLKHIDLCDCQLLTAGVNNIIQAAKSLTTLKYFDVSCDCRTDLLVHDIATLIANNKNIAVLKLPNCSLNNNQVKVVLNAMKECSLLTHVNVNINEVNEAMITDVIAVMENNSRINELKIFKLTLTQNMMHHFRKTDFMKFRGMQHLNIVGCMFDYTEWKILKQLVAYNATIDTLFLSDCLDLISVKILHMVYNSKNLNHFALVKCKVGGFVESVWWNEFFHNTNLLYLDFSYSKISGELAASILTKSINLTHIEMVSCEFDIGGIFSVCKALLYHINIVQLNLNNNKNIGYSVTEMAAIIQHNKNLMHIEMAACNLDKDVIITICKSICSCSRIRHINLSHNEITGTSTDAVVSMLLSTRYLEYINLQKCGLHSIHCNNVIIALEGTRTLKCVDLSLNEMVAECSAIHIATMINNNNRIEVLCLPDGMDTCANSSIDKVSLPSYSLSNCNVKYIFNAIKQARSFKCLGFGLSQVNDDLASEVAEITATNKGLVQLKISELILTHSGFKQISNSIMIMEGLNTISITGVRFTYTESCYLASLINNNKSLESFDISDCVIPEKGKDSIFEAMIKFTSLKSLNLKNIVISDTLEDKVLVVIANNTQLKYLEVTGCEMNTTKLSELISSFNDLI